MKLLKRLNLFVLIFLITFIFMSCGHNKVAGDKALIEGLQIKYENLEYKFTYNNCDFNSVDCTSFYIIYPNIKSGLSIQSIKKINSCVKKEIYSLLNYDETRTIDFISKVFFEKYKESVKLLKNEKPWKINLKCEVVFENLPVVSIKFSFFSYIGGIFEIKETRVINFHSGLNRNITFKDIILEEQLNPFNKYAELKFRESLQLFDLLPLNQYGFTFNENTFHLPKVFGFSDRGLILFYNENEIASQDKGYFEVLLPYEDISQFLNKNILKDIIQ